jgi:hypothetical protein
MTYDPNYPESELVTVNEVVRAEAKHEVPNGPRHREASAQELIPRFPVAHLLPAQPLRGAPVLSVILDDECLNDGCGETGKDA